MTSFKRGYNVILRSCFHQNQRFALTTIVNAHFWAAFMLILRRRFETLIQNADPKRRSRKYCSCFRRRRYVYRRRHVSEFSECLIQAIVRAQVNRKGRHLNVYNVILRSCFHQNQTTFVNAHFWAFWSAFWRVYSKISWTQQRFALTTFENAILASKVKHKRTPFWIGVLKRVYSKISMDATAFCSNHVWKRWFWPQKLSINAP